MAHCHLDEPVSLIEGRFRASGMLAVMLHTNIYTGVSLQDIFNSKTVSMHNPLSCCLYIIKIIMENLSKKLKCLLTGYVLYKCSICSNLWGGGGDKRQCSFLQHFVCSSIASV